MARFVFKLRGVLRQRKHLQQEKQRELAIRQREMLTLEQELLSIQQAVAQANDDVRTNRLVGALNMPFLAAHRRFIIGMQRQALSAVQRISLAQRRVEEARAALAEAMKQRKVIEKLRDQQLERWRESQQRKELSDLDEAGMQLAYQNLADESAATDGNA